MTTFSIMSTNLLREHVPKDRLIPARLPPSVQTASYPRSTVELVCKNPYSTNYFVEPSQNGDLASQNAVVWRSSEIIAHLLLTFYSKAPIFLQGVYRRGMWHAIKPICCKAHCT